MGSRIFWVLVTGIALVTGIVLQDGDRIFAWATDGTDISAKTELAIESSVDRAIEGSFDNMKVVGSDGEEIDVPPETKRAMANAVASLVKAETDLAMLKIRDGDAKEVEAATARRVAARAEVDRLKAVIHDQEKKAALESAAVREQIRSEIREDVRSAVRDATGN